MIDILKIITIFILMVALLRKKWNLGIVMALSSVILAVFYLLPPLDFLRAFRAAITDKTTVLLILALTLIRVFENVMRKRGIMQQMMDGLRGMVVDRRILMASMPALIGLLPSMGGALFSAPLVDEASKGVEISPEKKSFVNYVFRHPWEFIFPLYPGLILASAITSYELRSLIVMNVPAALCLTGAGILWGLRGISAQDEGLKKLSRHEILSFLPLTAIILMVIVLDLDLSLSIGAVTLCLFFFLDYDFKEIMKSFQEGFSRDIVMIILGVMTFKEVLTYSGAVANISSFFSTHGIPVMPVLFFLPFLSGLLTGLTVGYVGSTFPIIVGIDSAQNLPALSFAFVSGYVGVLLSPVHLCLILTHDYFKASLSEIYVRTAKAGVFIMVVTIVQYLFLTRYWLAR